MFFILAGANHFLHPAIYLKIMPPVLPFPLPLIYLSGFLESAFGLGLFFPGLQRLAAKGLILLLLAILPANVYMALHADLFPGFHPALLWLRLPFQFILMASVHWAARQRRY